MHYLYQVFCYSIIIVCLYVRNNYVKCIICFKYSNIQYLDGKLKICLKYEWYDHEPNRLGQSVKYLYHMYYALLVDYT